MGCGSSTPAGAAASGPEKTAGARTETQSTEKPTQVAPERTGDSHSVKESGKSNTKRERPWIIKETEDVRNVYEFDNILGKGQFGTTRLAKHKKTGELAACKSISKRKLATKDDVEDVRREVQILYHLAGHDNVVQIKGVYEDTQYVHIIMEYADIRDRFHDVISDRALHADAMYEWMNMVMNPQSAQKWKRLADFLICVLARRDRLMRAIDPD